MRERRRRRRGGREYEMCERTDPRSSVDQGRGNPLPHETGKGLLITRNGTVPLPRSHTSHTFPRPENPDPFSSRHGPP